MVCGQHAYLFSSSHLVSICLFYFIRKSEAAHVIRHTKKQKFLFIGFFVLYLKKKKPENQK